MLKDPPLTRIVIRPTDIHGRVIFFLFDPSSRRLIETGMRGGPDQASIETQVHRLKNQLERAGNRVEVVGG